MSRLNGILTDGVRGVSGLSVIGLSLASVCLDPVATDQEGDGYETQC